MPIGEYKPYPKSVQLQNSRQKPKQKQRGRITPTVYEKAMRRAQGRCERCGWVNGSVDDIRMGLQAAHLVRRRHLKETTENDIAMLCGPSVNTGTCHWWVDSTMEGKLWAIDYRDKLMGKVAVGYGERFED